MLIINAINLIKSHLSYFCRKAILKFSALSNVSEILKTIIVLTRFDDTYC